MKKKSLVTMVASLALVGAVGVGSTLAYLSSTTGTLVNSFSTASGYTGDEQAVQIQETNVDTNKKTSFGETVGEGENAKKFTGNAYTDLLPGDSVTKDPNVLLGTNSIDSYVFIKLEGADELEATDYDKVVEKEFAIEGLNTTNWEKVYTPDGANLDGIYVYKTVDENGTADYKVTAGTKTADLFTGVAYNKDITVELTADQNAALSKIELTAYAVQYKNVSLADAINLVKSK